MPRPIARTAAVPPTTPPRVRDFTAPRAPSVRVSFDVRTVYDFVFSLSEDAGDTDDLPAPDRVWLQAAKGSLAASLGPDTVADLEHLAVIVAGLVVDRPEVRTAADFVRLVDSVPESLVIETVLGEDLREPATAAIAARALEGDADALEELVTRRLEDHPGAGRVVALLRDPASMLLACRTLLAGWLPHFAEVEPRVLSILERDIALRAADRRSLAPLELIETTTGGIRWQSEVGVGRVILAPSYFTRPYNYLLGGGDWRLYGYPVADAALDLADPLAPPQAVVRLHRALGDDSRLRILRLLRDRDLYLTEIAGLLDLSKPTVKHHLATLRAAGLVTVVDEGGMTYYSLRRDRLDAASADLKRFLLG